MRDALTRWLQVLHLALLTVVPVLYAAIVNIAPASDPLRQSLTVGLALLSAFWAAVLIAAALRHHEEADWKRRAFAAYRRLLNRMPTLAGSTLALAVVALLLGFALFAHRQIVFRNETEIDVTIYLNDPDQPERPLVTVQRRTESAARLRIGERWIFVSPSADPARLFSPSRLRIGRWPADVPTFTIAEIPAYER